jgi:hypothetical protein
MRAWNRFLPRPPLVHHSDLVGECGRGTLYDGDRLGIRLSGQDILQNLLRSPGPLDLNTRFGPRLSNGT